MKAPSPRKSKFRTGPVEEKPIESAKGAFPIVGVGASAGGLEAFRQLLQHVPRDSGMGFVLVQHLAPKHESALPELLARSIELPVSEVKDGMAVEPNHVYVIPPNTSMGIRSGRLHLMPRTETHGQHMPIDYYLRSLAADQGNTAIGVILSGTGSDGTLGMKAIKAEGGITFAQDAASAKYPSMPQSAMTAGCVDVVMPPDLIARELERISRHPYLAQPKTPETIELPAENGDELRRILALLHNHSKVNFDLYKHTTIKRRVRRRMVLHKIDRPRDYVRFLEENSDEVDALFQDILINVTGFFRDPGTFEILRKNVFPALLNGRKARTPIRIWIPGCSTGEEVYSIAIALLEFLGDRVAQFPLQIFATDISQSAIEKARSGVYLENITADVPPDRLRRFFLKLNQGYQIIKSIRDACIFARHDVTRDPPFSRVDLISCRNVLIYLGPLFQKKVLSFFEYALRPGGFLFLGASESISESSEAFILIDKKHKIYSRKFSAARPIFNFAADYLYEKGRAERYTPEPEFSFDLQKEINRVLLSRYVPAGVVINEDLDILQFRGRTGPFLEASPGSASLSLSRMAREGLLVDLRAAIQKAKNNDRPIRKEGIEIRSDGRSRTVNIDVVPIKGPSPEKRYFLVLFEESPSAPAPESRKVKAVREARRQKAEERESARLKEELAQTKGSLRSIIEQQETTNEELRSANEEILSSSEEMQSTNEELETAKEELQSTNEELTTLNEELQNRNLQLSVVNSDLNNLLASFQIPIVMVSSDLRIMRVTPTAEKLFNLTPGDLGRPIGNLRPNLDITDLEELIRQSIDTISTRERDVQDRDGHWYSLRVRPYLTVENKIDGAVLILLDINALKSEVTELRLHAEAIVEAVRTPLVVLDGNLRVKTANRAFYEIFQTIPEQTEEHLIYDLEDWQWNLPRLRELLEEILPKKTLFENFEVKHEFPRVGYKSLLLHGGAIRLNEGRDPLILLAMEDITEREQTESRYRDLLESAPDAVAVVDAEGTIVLVNAEVENVFGYRKGELVGQKIETLIPERFRGPHRGHRQDYANELRRRPMGLGLELFGLRKDGREFPVEISLSPLRTQEATLITCAIRDLTERKRTAEALRVLNEVITLASEAEDIRTMNNRCLETVCKLEGCQVGQVWFVDEVQKVLRCDRRAFYSLADVAAFRNSSLQTTVREGEGLLGRVWKTNSPQWISDLQAEPDFARREEAVAAGFQFVFAFPIGIGAKLYAIWEFFSSQVRDPNPYLLEAATKLGNHLAIVYERKQATESLSALSGRLMQLQDEERRRIARDLHDSTAQTLAAAAVNLSQVEKEAENLGPKASKLLGESSTLLDQASQEIRTLALLLHPPMLDQVGLGSALSWYVEGFVKRSGIEVETDIPEDFPRLPSEMETALYRIAQEGLSNVRRHSGSKSARIRLAVDRSEVVLELSDHGKGLGGQVVTHAKAAAATLGVGIAGMRERVKQLGGRLEISSSEQGTKVKTTLPLPTA